LHHAAVFSSCNTQQIQIDFYFVYSITKVLKVIKRIFSIIFSFLTGIIKNMTVGTDLFGLFPLIRVPPKYSGDWYRVIFHVFRSKCWIAL